MEPGVRLGMVMEAGRLSKDDDQGKVYKRALLDNPGHCLLCAAPHPTYGPLCRACGQDLPRLEHACPRCARPQGDDRVCGPCLNSPPALERVCCPFVYAYPLNHIIQRMKFRGEPSLVREMGYIMATLIDRDQDLRDGVLVPVPLHPWRQSLRGYNQARVLAESLARRLRLRVDPACCVRCRYTRPQTRLAHGERSKNIKNAYRINRLPAFPRIILVDDVMTTGHTLNELATALLAHGAKRVDAWVLARTPEPGAC